MEMKYLKLFEGFREEFHTSVEDLQKKYESDKKKLFSDTKSEIDELMFDLTDDYSNQTIQYNDHIDNGPNLLVWYFLKCTGKEFLNVWEIIKECNSKLDEKLGLEIRCKISGFYLSASLNPYTFQYEATRKHEYNHGVMSRINEMQEYINSIEDTNRPDRKSDSYEYFEIQIQVV
jgi:hypothetical protein